MHVDPLLSHLLTIKNLRDEGGKVKARRTLLAVNRMQVTYLTVTFTKLICECLPVSPPQFPTDEALQCRITFIHQCTAATTTECQSVAKTQRLSIIEDVTFSVIRGRTSRRLVTKLRTSFDR